MKRHMLAALAAGLLAPGAFAQLPTYQRPLTGPGYRPAISPYLNLRFGPGGYFNLTRPQRDAFGRIGQLQTDLQALQTPIDATGSLGGLPAVQSTTGHPVAFFNYGQYYTFPFPRYGPSVGGFGTMAPGAAPGLGLGNVNQLGAPPGGVQRNRVTPLIGVGVR